MIHQLQVSPIYTSYVTCYGQIWEEREVKFRTDRAKKKAKHSVLVQKLLLNNIQASSVIVACYTYTK
jgi:hypothetical protein